MNQPMPMHIEDHPSSEGDESEQESRQYQRCRGITASGEDCKRAASLEAHGYCYQHVHQRTDVNEDNEVHNDHVVPTNNNNNNNNDEDDDEDDQEDDDNDEDVGLSRCAAVATTTKLRCKKLVSFAGEQYCPTHGGRQHKPKIVLHQCQAITKTTRQQCKRRVNFEREQFCSHHGGRKVSEAQNVLATVAAAAPQLMRQREPITIAHFVKSEHHSRWPSSYDGMALAQACMQFLCETHPRMLGKCGCDTTTLTPISSNAQPIRICRSMAIVRWVQTLVKLMQQSANPTDIGQREVLIPLMEQLTIQSGHGNSTGPLFADLRTAVAIFGSSSSSSLLDFLPALFTHMRRLNVTMCHTPSLEETNKMPVSRSPSLSSLAAWSDIAPMLGDDDTHGEGGEEDVF